MIETRIASVLSEDLVVLSGGLDLGIKEGMEFMIYETGDEVLDPQTKVSLGRLETVKGRVAVSHVQEKQSTARTVTETVYKTRRVDPLGAMMASSFIARDEVYTVDVATKLRVGKLAKDFKESLIVKTGDSVRQIG